jgi:hypothetical protein
MPAAESCSMLHCSRNVAHPPKQRRCTSGLGPSPNKPSQSSGLSMHTCFRRCSQLAQRLRSRLFICIPRLLVWFSNAHRLAAGGGGAGNAPRLYSGSGGGGGGGCEFPAKTQSGWGNAPLRRTGQAPLRQTWAPLRLPNPSCHHAPAPRCPPSSAWASCAAPSAWWVGVGCTEVVSRGSRASGVTLRAPRTRSAPQHAGSPPITTYHHLFVGGYVVGWCGGV